MKPSVWSSGGSDGPGGALPFAPATRIIVADAGSRPRSAAVRVLVAHAGARLALPAAAVPAHADRLLALVARGHDLHREGAPGQAPDRHLLHALAAHELASLAVHEHGHLLDPAALRLVDREAELAPVDAAPQREPLRAVGERPGDREGAGGVRVDRLLLDLDRRVLHVFL